MCMYMHAGDEGKQLQLYLPSTTWYDWYTQNSVTDTGGVTITVDTPRDMLPVSPSIMWEASFGTGC